MLKLHSSFKNKNMRPIIKTTANFDRTVANTNNQICKRIVPFFCRMTYIVRVSLKFDTTFSSTFYYIQKLKL